MPLASSPAELTIDSLQCWVAIKVFFAHDSKGADEIRKLRAITCRTQHQPGQQSFPKFLDHFVHRGSNGFHLCLVFEFLGPTLGTVLSNYRDRKKNLPADRFIEFACNILQAVYTLHKAGWAHGGKYFSPSALLSLIVSFFYLSISKPQFVDLSLLTPARSQHQ